MNFYPLPNPVPHTLRTDEFVIQPLTPSHVALDYAALMSNKEMLRLWSGSPWPNDTFSLTENQEDLAWHWDEHQKRIAFTFTVLNPAEDSCLGCIYIKPFAEVLAHNETWKPSQSKPAEIALVRFWVVQNRQGLDKTLLQTMRHWFRTEWTFSEIYWHTPANNSQQRRLFQRNGLQNVGAILLPSRGGDHILFR